MKRAVVLAGGGARGSYQMGFWRAIRELGIDFQIVTGSSVGALNAALMASGNYEGGLEMWQTITTEDIIETSPTRISQLFDTDALAAGIKNVVGEVGGDAIKIKMSNLPLRSLIVRFLTEKNVRASGIEVGIMVSEYPTLKARPLLLSEIPFGMFDDYLLASSTVYPSMDPMEIAGKKYVDGGYSDNFPVNLALDMGAQEIIGVELGAQGLEAKYHTDFPVRVIRPYFKLGQSMVFDPAVAKRNIALGYNDTMKSFGKLEGSCFTFAVGETELMKASFGLYLPEKLAECGCVSPREKENYYKTIRAKSFSESRKRRFGRMRYELPLLAAETAADIFGVDPTPIYDCESLKSAVLAAFEPYKTAGSERAEQALSNAKPFAIKMQVSKEVSGADIASYFVSLISSPLKNTDSIRQIKNLSLIFPQEFFAALYITYLNESGIVK